MQNTYTVPKKWANWSNVEFTFKIFNVYTHKYALCNYNLRFLKKLCKFVQTEAVKIEISCVYSVSRMVLGIQSIVISIFIHKLPTIRFECEHDIFLQNRIHSTFKFYSIITIVRVTYVNTVFSVLACLEIRANFISS